MSELLLCLAQFRPKTANAEADEDCLDLVHDPRLLGDEVVPLTVWPFGILFFSHWDRDHAAVSLLAAQPAQQGAQQQFRIQERYDFENIWLLSTSPAEVLKHRATST